MGYIGKESGDQRTTGAKLDSVLVTFPLILIIILPFLSLLPRPEAAKVTGVVEESPGPLEYEVGLYREGKKSGNRYGRKLSK